MIDVDKVREFLALINEADEKIADRGPIKVLPRPPGEAPNVPALRQAIEDLRGHLHVRRGYKTARGHDLDNAKQPLHYDLAAVGIVDDVKAVKAGTDRALPKSTTIVRVGFPGGEHLWFDPADLEPAAGDSSAISAPKKKGSTP